MEIIRCEDFDLIKLIFYLDEDRTPRFTVKPKDYKEDEGLLWTEDAIKAFLQFNRHNLDEITKKRITEANLRARTQLLQMFPAQLEQKAENADVLDKDSKQKTTSDSDLEPELALLFPVSPPPETMPSSMLFSKETVAPLGGDKESSRASKQHTYDSFYSESSEGYTAGESFQYLAQVTEDLVEDKVIIDKISKIIKQDSTFNKVYDWLQELHLGTSSSSCAPYASTSNRSRNSTPVITPSSAYSTPVITPSSADSTPVVTPSSADSTPVVTPSSTADSTPVVTPSRTRYPTPTPTKLKHSSEFSSTAKFSRNLFKKDSNLTSKNPSIQQTTQKASDSAEKSYGAGKESLIYPLQADAVHFNQSANTYSQQLSFTRTSKLIESPKNPISHLNSSHNVFTDPETQYINDDFLKSLSAKKELDFEFYEDEKGSSNQEEPKKFKDYKSKSSQTLKVHKESITQNSGDKLLFNQFMYGLSPLIDKIKGGRGLVDGWAQGLISEKSFNQVNSYPSQLKNPYTLDYRWYNEDSSKGHYIYSWYIINIKSPKVKEVDARASIKLVKFGCSEAMDQIKIEYAPFTEKAETLATFYYDKMLTIAKDKTTESKRTGYDEKISNFLLEAGRLAHLLVHTAAFGPRDKTAKLTFLLIQGIAMAKGINLGEFKSLEQLNWDVKALTTVDREQFARWVEVGFNEAEFNSVRQNRRASIS